MCKHRFVVFVRGDSGVVVFVGVLGMLGVVEIDFVGRFRRMGDIPGTMGMWLLGNSGHVGRNTATKETRSCVVVF